MRYSTGRQVTSCTGPKNHGESVQVSRSEEASVVNTLKLEHTHVNASSTGVNEKRGNLSSNRRNLFPKGCH